MPPSVSGAAYPLAVKALATVVVLALAYWGWNASDDITRAAMPTSSVVFLVCVLLVVVLCYLAIMYSRTTVTPTHIRQTWLWPKEVPLESITQVKFIRIRGLTWLITPRLVVRVGFRGLYTFPSADERVQQVFTRMAGSSREIPSN
jgi:hypothetical protein